MFNNNIKKKQNNPNLARHITNPRFGFAHTNDTSKVYTHTHTHTHTHTQHTLASSSRTRMSSLSGCNQECM